MIKVFIPRFRSVDEENGKSHTVFEIIVNVSGKQYKIEKRYHDIHYLHKELKKLVITPEFPPKRLRNWNPKVLEQRRQGLENYFQILTKSRPLPTPLLLFLDVPVPDLSQNKTKWKEETMTHQPILTFTRSDIFAESPQMDNLPDIVVKGVIMGLFGDENDSYHSYKMQQP